MKRELLSILVCPVCKGKLELKTEEERGPEIVSGALSCACCQATYQIIDAIPNLLPPQQKTRQGV